MRTEPIQARCPRCGTGLCETSVGPVVCPRCELAGALGEAKDLPFSGKLGNYDLESLIAHGGMGAVYRARHRHTDQIVAIKIPLAGRLANTEMRQRFLRETNLAAKLRHPNIVPLLEVGEAEGLPYLAMEFMSAKNLADIVRDGPLPPNQAAVHLVKVAQAVAHAHELGILHRDIKPANILFDEDGEPRVADFGLAIDLDLELTSELTVTGQVLGSPGYLAPERIPQGPEAQARTADAASVASDVYSLGATLYHLLTGRPPFQAATLDALLMQAVKTEPITPRKLNPSVSSALEAVCLKCLEKEPSRRYLGAKDLVDDLQRFLSGQAVNARLPSPLVRSVRWCRRRPVVAGLIGAVTFLVFAVMVVLVVATLRIQRDALHLRGQLVESLLAQARAENRSNLAGNRDKALAAIRKASAIEPTLDLRNEAIAALAQPDLLATGEGRMPRAKEALFQYATDPQGQYFIFPSQGGLAFEQASNGLIAFVLECPLGPQVSSGSLLFGGKDQRWLLGHTYSNTVTVWDLITRRAVWHSTQKKWPPPLATLLSNRNELVFSEDLTNLLFVDLFSAQVTRTSTLPVTITGLRPSPDGERIAVWQQTNFWVARFPNLIWKGPWRTQSPIVGGGFDSSGWRLVWTLNDNSFWLFDFRLGDDLGHLAGHSALVTSMVTEQSARWMASTSEDGTTRLWDLLSGQQEVISPLSGNRLRWHEASGKFSLRQYGTNGLTWLEFQRPPASIALVPWFDLRQREMAAPCLNHKGRVLAATAADFINLLDVRTGENLGRLLGDINAGRVVAAFEPADRALICGTAKGLFRWPLRWHGEELLEVGLKETVLTNIACESLALDRTGRWLAISEASGQIHLRDPSGVWRGIAQNAAGLALAISPDGRRLAGGSSNQDWLRVWDTASGQLLHEFKTSPGVAPGFTPEGRLFAITSTELAFWNLYTGSREELFPRDYLGSLRGAAVWSGDGQFMAFSRSRTRVDLLHAPTRKVLASFDALDNTASLLALDEHGTELVIGKARQFFERWDLRSLRRELAKLNLDWDLPPLPTEEPSAGKPLRVVIKR